MEVEQPDKKRKRSKNNHENDINSKGKTKVKKISNDKAKILIDWFGSVNAMTNAPRFVSTRGRELLQHLLRFESMVNDSLFTYFSVYACLIVCFLVLFQY
jgi:hypothetical protein